MWANTILELIGKLIFTLIVLVSRIVVFVAVTEDGKPLVYCPVAAPNKRVLEVAICCSRCALSLEEKKRAGDRLKQ